MRKIYDQKGNVRLLAHTRRQPSVEIDVSGHQQRTVLHASGKVVSIFS